MKRDTHITTIVFRMVTYARKEAPELLALFPYERWDNRGHHGCYARIGQHGGCHYRSMIKRSRPATEAEYTPLKRELENIGYNLKIISKRGKPNVP